MRELEEKGYAIIPGALEIEECDELYSQFWDYMETMNPELDRNSRSTWTKSNLPLNTKGLIQNYGVGFQRFNVNVHMKLKWVFEMLYDTPNLWSSFDGVSFSQRGKQPKYKDLKDWETKCWSSCAVHVDQTTPGFLSIQSGVAISNQPEDHHVFVCIPGSHKYHEELLQIWEDEAKEQYRVQMEAFKEGDKKPKLAKSELHWQVMSPGQLKFVREKGLQMKRIALKRGDMVLWQSRTIHSSAPYCRTAPEDAMRLHMFVCMRPVPEDEEVVKREMKIRREAYANGRVSKHSADHIRLFGKQPRMYSKADKETHDKMQVPPSTKMSEEEEQLYGLRAYN